MLRLDVFLSDFVVAWTVGKECGGQRTTVIGLGLYKQRRVRSGAVQVDD